MESTMADSIAVLVMALQYGLIVSIFDLYFGKALPLWIVVGIFVVLSTVGIALWHKKKSWQTAKQWRKLIFISLILGVGFFASDLVLAYLHGQTNPLHVAGGLLGLPLTIAICPGFTMICVAGLVRSLYLNRTSVAHT